MPIHTRNRGNPGTSRTPPVITKHCEVQSSIQNGIVVRIVIDIIIMDITANYTLGNNAIEVVIDRILVNINFVCIN